MLEKSVKLSRLIIFYFISNFRTNSSKQRAKNQCFSSVSVFLEQCFSSSTVVSVAQANVLQTPTIAVFAPNWSWADPNFAPFRWRILIGSQWVPLFISQSECDVCYPFLPKNCISVSQSQSRNFFLYIIIAKNIARTARTQLEGRHLLFGDYLRSWTTLNVHYRRWT